MTTLKAAGCELLDVRNCFCSNEDLQLQVSVCVVETCKVEDQAGIYSQHFTSSLFLDYGLTLIYTAATLILQNGICYDIPQPSRSAEIIRDVIIISAITFPIIALRFVSRSLVSNRLWLDDWAVVVAAVRSPEIQSTDTFINDLGQILMIPMVVIPIYSMTLLDAYQFHVETNDFRCYTRLRKALLGR